MSHHQKIIDIDQIIMVMYCELGPLELAWNPNRFVHPALAKFMLSENDKRVVAG